MLYTEKIPHPANFAFARTACTSLRITSLGSDVFRIHQSRWHNPSHIQLAEAIPGESHAEIKIAEKNHIQILDASGRPLLSGVPGATLGRAGTAWMFQFRHTPEMRFYGLGEHSGPFEKTGRRVRFWNTDLIGDYDFDQIRRGEANPMYIAIPWLIIKQRDCFVGILVHHPGAVFMDLASNFIWESKNRDDINRNSFYVGAPDGEPDIYLVYGPSLAELTRKLQSLVGRTALPPLWSLGFHQSRWGYAGPRDLAKVYSQLRAAEIPCDALWLDIDYMDDYKVFTLSPQHWGKSAPTKKARASLSRMVAVLDPGVKCAPKYEVQADGIKQKIFCLNKTGVPFTGFAWPGRIHLPDFSLPETRVWWARRVAHLAKAGGFAGFWIDMNDPSVGSVEPHDMLFDHGRLPHAAYHNQYALGMAQATHAGLLTAHPDSRPFILSRSACASSSRYTAVWSGDNFSNWHHLRTSIPLALNLALSGLPFNGADIGGFADSTTRQLLVAWHKAALLFPFYRNHNSAGVRAQEPWAFGAATERIIARIIRLRYRFLPYLYQLFAAQELHGDAILRPLMHDFPDQGQPQSFDRIEDQFLIGPALMHAPIVHEGMGTRDVVLPAGTKWFSLIDACWHDGGQTLKSSASPTSAATPLFVRDASLVPMRAGPCTDPDIDLRAIELHAYFSPRTKATATLEYHADDGASFAYRKGERTTVRFSAQLSPNGTLTLWAESLQGGYGPLRVRIVANEGIRTLCLQTSHTTRRLSLHPHTWRAGGKPIAASATPWIEIPLT